MSMHTIPSDISTSLDPLSAELSHRFETLEKDLLSSHSCEDSRMVQFLEERRAMSQRLRSQLPQL